MHAGGRATQEQLLNARSKREVPKRKRHPSWRLPGIGQLLLRCLNSGIHAVACPPPFGPASLFIRAPARMWTRKREVLRPPKEDKSPCSGIAMIAMIEREHRAQGALLQACGESLSLLDCGVGGKLSSCSSRWHALPLNPAPASRKQNDRPSTARRYHPAAPCRHCSAHARSDPCRRTPRRG
jgi:hypothetical protein